MKYKLSFASVQIINGNVAEIIVNPNTLITLEMCEEYDAFLLTHFEQPFAILNNKVNSFSYTFEANLHIASLENLRAIAVVNYNNEGSEQSKKLVSFRPNESWDFKEFSALQCGRKQAIAWLETVLQTYGVVTK